MKIIYDNETDSLYVEFTDDTVVESQEQEDGSVVDFITPPMNNFIRFSKLHTKIEELESDIR